MSPREPADEPQRLATLDECQILDTPREESFDEIAQLAADLCGAPMAAVSFLDADRQWFKARVGLPMESTPRQDAFCDHALTGSEALVVDDVFGDPRFAANPLVLDDPHVRFYAGVPLRLGEGSALGTLCVLDRQPRTLTARQLDGLQMLARHIVRELRLRRDLAEARRQVAPERLPVQPGELLQGRWRLVRPIGEGSVGVVFEAYERSGARVALKFLRPAWMVHRLVVERFVREARILTRISSPHVSRILDVGNLPDARGNIPFLVMEYLEGTDLEAVRRRSDRVPWPRVVAWALDLCAALTEIHALDIVHRDLKPSNVFLSQGDDGTEVIKLVDFGIAKETIPASEEPLTEVDRLLGSVPYMSPEQLKSSRDVDARSDLWSLGVLLHELLTGQLPFPGETVLAICATVLSRPPLPMRASGVELPAGLESIVRRCLQREPGERYASAQALAEALRPLLRDPRAAS